MCDLGFISKIYATYSLGYRQPLISGFIKEVCVFQTSPEIIVSWLHFCIFIFPMVFSSSLDSVYLFDSETHLGNLTSFHYCVQKNVLTPFFHFSFLVFCSLYIALLVWF